jgi:N-acetylglucosaminyl-diphospho-decaprenol L-rhamnosyltransferase
LGRDKAMTPTPLLSIAIVNWNTRDLLLQALESIYASPTPPLEVIVVDNASADESAKAVRERFPQADLIANNSNMGYAHGNNQAMLAARGTYILLLNPDVIVPPNGLYRAVEFMNEHPDAGALGVRQVHPDGRLQRSIRGFPSPTSVLWELLGITRLFPNSRLFGAYRMTWFGYDVMAEVDQPMGTFLLLSARAVTEVGMLDEAFPIFFNEVDWCLRCKRAGYKIFFLPDIQIVHYGGASTTQVGSAMAWESRRGLLKFYAKHYSSVWLLPIRLLIAAASWPYAWLQARRRK